MMKKYKADISMAYPNLDVDIYHSAIATKEDEEFRKKFYQWRIKERTGNDIALSEIKVSPAADEWEDVHTYLRFVENASNLHAAYLNRTAKYVIPLLLRDLNAMKQKTLKPGESRLLDHAISELSNAGRWTYEDGCYKYSE